jgi:hypothetical protein
MGGEVPKRRVDAGLNDLGDLALLHFLGTAAAYPLVKTAQLAQSLQRAAKFIE